ncbi:MAG: imidazoleglycerol phosphate dehydratase HisB [Planctomycetota bacterium]|jgi:imidazoleglycerol phosphate dehydratase HisB
MSVASQAKRTASVSRGTKETKVTVELLLDGSGRADIATGLPFLDHMLTALCLHSRIDLVLHAQGDVHVDDHHTVEDCALTLGQAIDEALGKRTGITRFAHAYAPLDEALCRAVIDLSGRPCAVIEVPFRREMLGSVATENLVHFLQSLATRARMALHVDLLRGDNDHHKAEAAFKAVALALRAAVKLDDGAMPSTKGVL